MIRFLLRRAFWGVIVVWVVATLVFLTYFAAPKDVARLIAGRQASEATVATVRVRLHLGEPILTQYGHYLGRLVRGDLGESYGTQEPVTRIIARDLPVTASLAFGAAVLWMVLGVGGGVLAAARPRTMRDRAVTGAAVFIYSTPLFLVGQTLLYLLFFRLYRAGYHVFPPGSYVAFSENPLQWARFLVLPWLTLALVIGASYIRLVRSSMLDALGEDYIRTARAKGISEARIIWRHAVRSSLAPVLAQFGIDLGALLGGGVITEVLFGLPGLGREAVQAVVKQDLPVIIGTTIVAAAMVVAANLAVDALQVAIDPRLRER